MILKFLEKHYIVFVFPNYKVKYSLTDYIKYLQTYNTISIKYLQT